jgi:hypothetical protein
MFSDRRVFKQHKKMSLLNEEMFKCLECLEQFKTNKRREGHFNSIHSNFTLDCEQCDKKFTRKDRLKDHKNIVHLGVCFPCTQCKEVFKRKCRLNEHIRFQHEGITFNCEICSSKFKRKDVFDKHMQGSHLGVVHRCAVCTQVFKRKDHLKNHERYKHKGLTYDCLLCGTKLKKKHSLNIHIKRCRKLKFGEKHLTKVKLRHFLNSYFPCPKCTEQFTNEADLKFHFSKEHAFKSQKYNTDIDLETTIVETKKCVSEESHVEINSKHLTEHREERLGRPGLEEGIFIDCLKMCSENQSSFEDDIDTFKGEIINILNKNSPHKSESYNPLVQVSSLQANNALQTRIQLVEGSLKGEDLEEFRKMVKQEISSQENLKHALTTFMGSLREKLHKSKLNADVITIK